jgi:hypothetical protein
MVFLENEAAPQYDGKLQVLTTSNQPDYVDHNNIVRAHPNYIGEYLSPETSPHAMVFVFDIPQTLQSDVDHIINGDLTSTSDEYRSLCNTVFADNPQILQLLETAFNPGENPEPDSTL